MGPEGGSPRLTRLNTSDWARAMNRARKAAKKLAFDLVDVYARRAATQGFRFSPDTPWQREMEEAFPYTETRDQLAAIADVKHDMRIAATDGPSHLRRRRLRQDRGGPCAPPSRPLRTASR
ncbi:MAG: hypothetical protein ACLTDR_06355 [Adlercreutzia equolifaciens]